MKKLAIISTHPIQYNAPLFKLLTARKRIELKVFYTWGESVLQKKYDPGFKQEVEWDIPLLEGYAYCFTENTATLPGSSHYNGIVNPKLIAELESWKPDALLVFGWAFKSHLKLMRHFKGRIPVFFRGDSTLLDDKSRGWKKMLRQIFLKWVYKHIDGAFYTGTHNKAYFKKMGLGSSQLFLAPHAVENERFDIADKAGSCRAFRTLHHIPEDSFVFLFAGKLESKKDPLLLATAFEKMQQPGCHLVFAGTGELELVLKQRFAGNDAIHFTGFQNQSQMAALYNACNVFVLPSKGPGETWGLAINEAMAAGKPVIASDRCGGAIDLIQEGRNGYIFPAGDASALSDAMHKIYGQWTETEGMGAGSLAIIGEFNFEKIATAIEHAVAGTYTTDV